MRRMPLLKYEYVGLYSIQLGFPKQNLFFLYKNETVTEIVQEKYKRVNDTAGNLLYSSEVPIVVQNDYLNFARGIHKMYFFFIQMRAKKVLFLF